MYFQFIHSSVNAQDKTIKVFGALILSNKGLTFSELLILVNNINFLILINIFI